MRLRLLALAIFAACVAHAQSVPITASGITDGSGSANASFTGQLCFTPTLDTGAAVGAYRGFGGQALPIAHCYNVANGALQSGATLLDTSKTSPVNLCYRVTYRLPGHRTDDGLYNPCYQPSSTNPTTLNLDNLVPGYPSIDLVQTGPQGVAGQVTIRNVSTLPAGASATVTNSGTPAQAVLDLALPQGLPGTAVGIFDASQFSGADMALKINSAMASCGFICTVRVAAGVYPTSNTITLRAPNGTDIGYGQLQLDAGAVINYSGSGHAVDMPVANTAGDFFSLVGGTINCTNKTAAVGIGMWPSNHQSISNTVVHGCNFGILNQGANQGTISHNKIAGNNVGIGMVGIVCNGTNCPGAGGYAPNAYTVEDNEIQGNGIGYVEMNGNVAVTAALKNVLHHNTLEGNTVVDVWSIFSRGLSVEDNYFESEVLNPIILGNSGTVTIAGQVYNSGTAFMPSIKANHFTTTPSQHPAGGSVIKITNAGGYSIEANEETYQGAIGSWPRCFVDIYTALPGIVGYNYTTIPEFGGGTYLDSAAGTGNHSTEAYYCNGNVQNTWPAGFQSLSISTILPPAGQALEVAGSAGMVVDGQTILTGPAILSSQCTTFGNGAKFCSGPGAPTIGCTVGGSYWANTGATVGTYSAYLCHNGTWTGQGPIF